MNITEIVQKSKSFGVTEVPAGSANNSQAQQVLLQIFKANPGKFFQTKVLGNLLAEAGCPVDKPGNLLFAMKKQDLCSSPQKGWYRDFDGKSNKVAASKPAGQ